MSDITELFGLRGQVAFVTGSSSGIGQAAAEGLALAGASVVVHGRDRARTTAVVEGIVDRGGFASAVTGDASDPEFMRGAVDAIVAQHGHLDIVMANAGIAGGPGYLSGEGRIAAVTDAEWQLVLASNLTSTFNTLREASRVMASGGRIIVTSSTAGMRSDPFVSYGYIATKAAQLNLVRQLALELAPRGIRVNAIAPGPIKNTRIGGDAELTPELEQLWIDTIPLGRMGLPAEIRGAVLFLGSEASSFVTGITVPVDGGALDLSHGAF